MNLAITLVSSPETPPAGPGRTSASAPAARPTAHACLRYAQRVLGMRVDEEQFRKNFALRRRCERGIGRLMDRAVRARADGPVEVWVARTRAMIVRDGCVLTILRSKARRPVSGRPQGSR
jgi:hypothetical protein